MQSLACLEEADHTVGFILQLSNFMKEWHFHLPQLLRDVQVGPWTGFLGSESGDVFVCGWGGPFWRPSGELRACSWNVGLLPSEYRLCFPYVAFSEVDAFCPQ